MSVKVVIPESFLVASGGITELETAGQTVGECLKEAAGKAPALQKLWFTSEGGLSKFVLLFLNGENVPGNNLDQTIKDGDEIYPLLVIGGG
jgi:molybdopterin converting factor small subunit